MTRKPKRSSAEKKHTQRILNKHILVFVHNLETNLGRVMTMCFLENFALGVTPGELGDVRHYHSGPGWTEYRYTSPHPPGDSRPVKIGRVPHKLYTYDRWNETRKSDNPLDVTRPFEWKGQGHDKYIEPYYVKEMNRDCNWTW